MLCCDYCENVWCDDYYQVNTEALKVGNDVKYCFIDYCWLKNYSVAEQRIITGAGSVCLMIY